jgi:hypothetical protein
MGHLGRAASDGAANINKPAATWVVTFVDLVTLRRLSATHARTRAEAVAYGYWLLGERCEVLEIAGPRGELVALDELYAFDPARANSGASVAPGLGAASVSPVPTCAAPAAAAAARPQARPRPRRACSLTGWR